MNRLNVLVGQGIPRPAAPKVSGMMEVIAPEDGFVLETHLPLLRHNGLGRTDAMKEQKSRHNGKLHVFGPEEEVVIEPVQTVPRMGCGNESTSRPYTPSKQIMLCTAKSLEKRNALLSRTAKTKKLKMNIRRHDCIEEESEIVNDQQLKTDLKRLYHEMMITEAKIELEENDESMKNSRTDGKAVTCEDCTEQQRDNVEKQNSDEKPPDSSDDEDDNQLRKDEIGKRTAPLQLMGEFLKAIMERKYSLAKKLCQMTSLKDPRIPNVSEATKASGTYCFVSTCFNNVYCQTYPAVLIYEPQNPEAKQFLPLIEQKLLLESEQDDKEDEETGEGSSDESEEETNSSENSETESEASSEDSDKISRNLEVP